MTLHEKTTMKTLDTFHRDPKLEGIGAVVGAFGTYDVAVNANFCYSSDPRLGFGSYPPPNGMTDRCHGIFVTDSTKKFFGTSGDPDVPFEGPNADYISFKPGDGVDIRTGIVPTAPVQHQEALGGFASKLENYGGDHPWYGVGDARDKKLVFVITSFADDTAGGGSALKQRLADSGVPPLPGGAAGEIQCIAGDGGTSTAIAYKLEGGGLEVKRAGTKHFRTGGKVIPKRGDYFINTYLLFSAEKFR